MSGRTPWHQDAAVLSTHGQKFCDMVTVWIPFTKTTKNNGCMITVKEINKMGMLNHISGYRGQVEIKNSKHLKPSLFFSSKVARLPLQNKSFVQYTDLEIYYVSIGEKLKIVALGAEIFNEYSIWLRDMLSNSGAYLLTVGYSNGMVGYIPTSGAIHEGGYEVERAFKEFAQTSPFSDKIEKVIKRKITELIDMEKYED